MKLKFLILLCALSSTAMIAQEKLADKFFGNYGYAKATELYEEVLKKGDTSLPDNYRPISLVTVGYKIFASLLLNRLRDDGAQKKIWTTQFGFKQSAGPEEPVHRGADAASTRGRRGRPRPCSRWSARRCSTSRWSRVLLCC